MPYVNFFSVVVDRCDQSRLVPTDVEDREFSNLVGVGKNCPHLLNIQEIGTPNLIEPLNQACRTIRVHFCKIVQPFSRNDVHS